MDLSRPPAAPTDGRDAATHGQHAAEALVGPRWRPWVWIRRYVPAEIAAVIGAVVPAWLVAGAGSTALTTLAALIGESVAFYAVIVGMDLRAAGRRDLRTVRTLVRGWLIEFGPAEVIDTAIRPFALYVAIAVIDDAVVGSFVGKVAADLVFYLFAVIGFELAHLRRIRRTAQRSRTVGADSR